MFCILEPGDIYICCETQPVPWKILLGTQMLIPGIWNKWLRNLTFQTPFFFFKLYCSVVDPALMVIRLSVWQIKLSHKSAFHNFAKQVINCLCCLHHSWLKVNKADSNIFISCVWERNDIATHCAVSFVITKNKAHDAPGDFSAGNENRIFSQIPGSEFTVAALC